VPPPAGPGAFTQPQPCSQPPKEVHLVRIITYLTDDAEQAQGH